MYDPAARLEPGRVCGKPVTVSAAKGVALGGGGQDDVHAAVVRAAAPAPRFPTLLCVPAADRVAAPAGHTVPSRPPAGARESESKGGSSPSTASDEVRAEDALVSGGGPTGPDPGHAGYRLPTAHPRRYRSDASDAGWRILAPHLPAVTGRRGGRARAGADPAAPWAKGAAGQGHAARSNWRISVSATSSRRGPEYGLRACAMSTLSMASTSPSCHVNAYSRSR